MRVWVFLLSLLLLSAVAVTLASSTTAAAEGGERGGIVIVNPLCVGEEELEAQELLVLFGVLVVSIIATYFLLKFHFHYLPESVATILIGIIIGVGIRLSGNNLTEVVRLDPELFFIFLLPGIIFDAGYNLEKGDFFGNIGSICAFAVGGTAISVVAIGCGGYILGQIGWSYPLPFLDSFLFGSLISAVDPVATLAIFSALGVNPTLYMVVFGESVVNDAVSIVFFRTFAIFTGEEVSGGSIAKAFGSFCLLFFGSVILGFVVVVLGSLFFKFCKIRKYLHIEVGMFLLLAFFPYLIAEALGLSGIMAILTAGIMMSHYVRKNLSKKGELVVGHVVHAFAFIAESWVFAYLGLAVFTFEHWFNGPFIVWSLILCLVGRALHIFPISSLLNRFRSPETKIGGKNQFIMWFSGLRGAIAFALAINMLRPEGPSEYSELIFTTTLLIVLFTVGLQGALTMPLLKLIGVEMAKSVDFSKSARMYQNTEEYWSTIMSERQKNHNCLSNFDRKYLQKWLVREKGRDVDTLNEIEQDSFAAPWRTSSIGDQEMKEMREMVVSAPDASNRLRSPVASSTPSRGDTTDLETALTSNSGVAIILRALRRNPDHARILKESLHIFDSMHQRFEGNGSDTDSDSE